MPRGSASFPRRAAPSVAEISNCMFKPQFNRQDAKTAKEIELKMKTKICASYFSLVLEHCYCGSCLSSCLSWRPWRLGGYSSALSINIASP
jgi:hypothetical protein